MSELEFMQMASFSMFHSVLNLPPSLLKIVVVVVLLSLSMLCPLDNILLLITIVSLLTIYVIVFYI